MKILYYVPNLQLCNGVASYSMNYFRKIVEKSDIKIDFLLTQDVPSPYYEEIKDKGGKIFVLPQTKNIFKIKNFVRKIFISESYDIVHSHVINRGGIVLKTAKRNGINIRILHSHTTANGDTVFKRLIRFPFKISALRSANIFFACSELAGNYLFKKKQFFVIHNAIDLSKFNFMPFEKKQARSAYPENLTFGTIGRFTKQKNPEFILKVINAVSKVTNDFKFIWVGSGELLEKIKKQAELYDINKYIDFIDSTTQPQMYYHSMDVFILPSIYEGLPVVGVEAQACGVPCVFSSNITDEILINENTCFCELDSEERWADKVFSLKGKVASVDNVFDKYGIDENANRLIEIYNSL